MFQNEALPFSLSKIPSSLQAVEKFPSAFSKNSSHRAEPYAVRKICSKDENFQIDFIPCHAILPLSFAVNRS